MSVLKKISVVGLALVLCCSFAIAATNATSSAAQSLSAFLNKYATYQARFKQTTYNEKGRKTQTSRGTMYLKRPGKFRWETSTPTNQIIIANNKTLWIYDVDLMQATKRKLRPTGGTDPAALLSGHIKNINKQFSVKALTSSKREASFLLTPKKKSGGFKSIRMSFYRGKLQRLTVLNSLNQTSVFEFSKIQLNAKLSSRLFIFTPPRGVDVLRQ